MGTGFRHVYFDEEGRAHRMSQARFERILDRRVREPVPELAGRRVRFLTLYIWFEDRVPIEVSRVDASIMTFDADGRRDPAEANGQLQAAVESLDEAVFRSTEPGVISAAARFKTAGLRWKPTKAEVDLAIAAHRLRESQR